MSGPGRNTATDEVIQALKDLTEGDLGPAALERVYRGARAAAQTSGRSSAPWVWAGAAAVVGVLVVLGSYVARHRWAEEPSRPSLIAQRGEVWVDAERAVSGGERGPFGIAPGSHVKTGRASEASLRLPQGVVLTLAAQSSLHLRHDDAPELEEGEARLSVSHQPRGHSFSVRAGDALVRVVGTEFTVGATAGSLRRVSVTSGVVALERPGEPVVLIGAGEQWPRLAPAPPAAPGLGLAPAPSPAPVRGRSARPRSSAQPGDTEPCAPRASPAQDPAVRAQELTASAECWLERGSRERARDLFAQAAQVGRGTAAGETALVEVGRLAALLEDSRVALAASDEYLRDYPNGRLREVAAFRRCEMLVALGHGTESASCLATYRAAYPRGLRRAQATLWLARLRQGTGSYVEAAELLAEFLRHAPRAKERADAWYELILCRERAGSAGSREALDSALKEFPEDPRLADLRRRMRP